MDTLFAAVVQTCCVAASASTFFYLSWSSGIAVSSQLSEIASENTSLIAQTFTFQKGLFIALWQSLSDFFFMRNTSNSKFLHLPLDQRPAFFKLNRDHQFSLSPSSAFSPGRSCADGRGFATRYPSDCSSSTGDDPAVACPSRFCFVLETKTSARKIIRNFTVPLWKLQK